MAMPFGLTLREFVGFHWAAIAIALTCFSLLLWFALVLAKYVRISLSIFLDTLPPLGTGPTDYERLEGERVRFRSTDGVSLAGAWLWADDPGRSRGTVLFCHEFRADQTSCALYARTLLEAGYNLFTFDFRNHGDSGKTESYRPLQWASDKELADVQGAVAYVSGRLADADLPTQIGLFGISRGAAAGILAAADNPDIAVLVCDGAFSTESVCISLMKRWARIFARVRLAYENHPEFFWRLMAWVLLHKAQRRTGCKYPSVRKALRRMGRRPVMFIYGRRDSYIDAVQARQLHAAAMPPKRLWLVPRAGHNQAVAVAPEAYARRTLAFFDRYLATQPEAKPVKVADRTRSPATTPAGSS